MTARDTAPIRFMQPMVNIDTMHVETGVSFPKRATELTKNDKQFIKSATDRLVTNAFVFVCNFVEKNTDRRVNKFPAIPMADNKILKDAMAYRLALLNFASSNI